MGKQKMYSTFVKELLLEASEIAKQWSGRTTGRGKGADPAQIVTEADLAIGGHLIDRIRSAYPGHGVIDEERGLTAGDESLTWVIDPIDGTSNFAAGVPMYGIMIGLLKGASPIAGGVMLPAFGEVYLAERGGGAFCNGRKISVDRTAALSDSLVAYGMDGNRERPEATRFEATQLAEIALRTRNVRMSNSAFDPMMVACGKYAACLNRTTRIWDNVAAQIIIEEAGGAYTAIDGRPLSYALAPDRLEENYTYCAGSPSVHSELVSVLGGAWG